MTPEFSRREKLDTIGAVERAVSIAADAGERAALAVRFALPSIDRLDATLMLVREGGGMRVRGRMGAELVQSCSVTGDAIPGRIDAPIDLLFVADDAADGEIELSEDACDIVVHDGSAIDVGEAVAETMALALDPFPRSPKASAVMQQAGMSSEGEAGPFGALAALRKDDRR